MNKGPSEIIEQMKADLLRCVEEWLGMDVPAEGSEDYDTWQSKLAEIDAIENIRDVIDYVESEGLDLDDFFLCGMYEVISAGLDPQHVPSELVKEMGDLVAEKACPGGSWVNVYLYDGKYFVVNEYETIVADAEADALKIAGMGNDSYDEILHSEVRPSEPQVQPLLKVKKASYKKARGKKRSVLIIVTDWPDGTMAFKFGGAMEAALNVAKGDMRLVQIAPERIFKVETAVSEAEFREAMRSSDVASGGSISFIEIPKR